MTDEVFKLMRHFPGSMITSAGEVILNEKGNVSFTVKGLEDPEDIKYKLLEWCSRDVIKGEPYKTEATNRNWRRSLLLGINNYLQTNFTEANMWVIYDFLGNAINHKRTIGFVNSGFDIGWFRSKECEDMKKL